VCSRLVFVAGAVVQEAERQRKLEEEREHQRKLDEIARKQREREAEIEARERERRSATTAAAPASLATPSEGGSSCLGGSVIVMFSV